MSRFNPHRPVKAGAFLFIGVPADAEDINVSILTGPLRPVLYCPPHYPGE